MNYRHTTQPIKTPLNEYFLKKNSFFIFMSLFVLGFMLNRVYISSVRDISPLVIKLPLSLSKLHRSGPPSLFEAEDVTVRRRDTLEKIFHRVGLDDDTLNDVLHSGPAAQQLRHIKRGDILYFNIDKDNDNSLEAIRYDIDPTHTLLVNYVDGKYVSHLNTISVQPHIRYVTSTVKNSLYAAAHSAGLPKKLIDELGHLLQYDVDFAHDIRPGDQFTVLYDQYYRQDQPLEIGHIVAAEFVNAGRKYRFIRYTDPKGHTDYYTPSGISIQRAFSRTPLKFTHISSQFNQHRLHPILEIIRPHNGVDYAARTGTPVKATASGSVVFRGRKGGYGNLIEIDHAHGYHTRYAHLSGFEKKIQIGSRIHQGDVIGFVGSTGSATGPHLHYEFLINGKYHDPIKVHLPASTPLMRRYRQDFIAKSNSLLAQLDLYRTATRASKNGMDIG